MSLFSKGIKCRAPGKIRLGSGIIGGGNGNVAQPFATLVSNKSADNVSGNALSTTGYIKVEWWDNTSNVYGTGSSGSNISWSKAAGGAGEKTLRIYPSDANGDLDGALTLLSCPNNSLTSLDVSGCTALQYLSCSFNSLTSLDVSGLTSLTSLSCSSNSLTSFRVVGVGANVGGWYWSSSYFFGGLQVLDNSLSAEALDQFYTDLAQTTSGIIFVTGNPGTTGDDPTIATAKGWTVYGS